MYKILSLSSGALKGIAQIALLEKLEEVSGKKTCEIFDMIGGSSAGAINASLLSMGLSAKDISKLYLEGTSKIISYNWKFWEGLFNINGMVSTLNDLIGKETTMNKTKTELVLFSLNLIDGINYSFSSHYEPEMLISEAMLRSISVPVFFPVYKNEWIDGGAGWLGNPTEGIVRRALSLGIKKKDMKILFLECGLDPKGFWKDKINNPYPWDYLIWIIEVILYDITKLSHNSIRQSFPGIEYLPFTFGYSKRYSSFSLADLKSIYSEAHKAADQAIESISKFILE